MHKSKIVWREIQNSRFLISDSVKMSYLKVTVCGLDETTNPIVSKTQSAQPDGTVSKEPCLSIPKPYIVRNGQKSVKKGSQP